MCVCRGLQSTFVLYRMTVILSQEFTGSLYCWSDALMLLVAKSDNKRYINKSKKCFLLLKMNTLEVFAHTAVYNTSYHDEEKQLLIHESDSLRMQRKSDVVILI